MFYYHNGLNVKLFKTKFEVLKTDELIASFILVCQFIKKWYMSKTLYIYFTSNRMLLFFVGFFKNYCYCYAHVVTCDLSICWYKLILLKFLITESSMTDKYGHNNMAATGLPPSGYNQHSTRYIIRNERPRTH